MTEYAENEDRRRDGQEQPYEQQLNYNTAPYYPLPTEAQQTVSHYSGYSSPPLGCFILFTFSLIVLSFFFLGAAFQKRSFLANSQFYLRNMNFKTYRLADEIADMKFSASSIRWALKLNGNVVYSSASSPVYANGSWDLGSVNIPYKVDNLYPYILELSYDGQIVTYSLDVVEEGGFFYVQKPLYIAFLATPSGQQKLRAAEPKYVDKFIGFSPISIKIFSTEAPEMAWLNYGPGGSVTEFNLFLSLLVVGTIFTVALSMFAVYALQIIDVADNFVVRTSGGYLLRKYEDPVEIRENQRVPLFN